MRKLTAAYLAGLIDGEGYLGIRKDTRGYYMPVLKVALCDEYLIDWLKSSFGGSKCSRKGSENSRDSWSWEIYHGKCMNVIDAVYPYLKIKAEQAEILKKLYATYKKESNYIEQWQTLGYGYGKTRTLKPEVKEYRDELYESIKTHNKRGTFAA